jgi:hypothetical protein
MPKYYRITDPSDVRDLGDQMAAWQVAGNPKADDWAVQPAAPSPDAVWTNGEWIIPPVALIDAETAVSAFFTPYQTLALQRLEMALIQAGKPLGMKMLACKQWLESVMLGWALNPVVAPASVYGQPSATFEEASSEAVISLQSN